MEAQHERWNEFYRTHGRVNHDNWLCGYESLLKASSGMKVLDLGCGNGVNLEYLLKWTAHVYALDYSEEAIEQVKGKYDVAATVADIRNELPYESRELDIIVSDLSLHYFSEEETFRIIGELHRVLKGKGMLLARLNSMKDKKHGAQQGKEIEPQYYENNGARKRFFTRETIAAFFERDFEILSLEEKTSGKYLEEKHLWEMAAMARGSA